MISIKRRIRQYARGDDSNLSIIVFGFEARLWMFLFILVEFVIGMSCLCLYLINRFSGAEKSETGLINLFWIAFLSTAILCKSKCCFSCLGVIVLITAFVESYVLIIKLLIFIESSTGDNFISWSFSVINGLYSVLVLIVVFRASCCNGLGNEHDLDMHAIVAILRERTDSKCNDCDDQDYLASVTAISPDDSIDSQSGSPATKAKSV